MRLAIQSGLLAAYRLASRTGVLQLAPIQRLFSYLYFIYKRRVEARGITALNKRITPGSLVMDVGANIGFFTVEFARRVGGAGIVLAFEPAQKNVDLLRWNLRRFGVNNVIVVPAALSDQTGPGILYLNPDHPADHRIFTGDAASPTEEIRLFTLDDYIDLVRDPRPISLIKIDVQGAELKVLRGMIRTLERFPEAPLFVEYTPRGLTDAGDVPETFLEFFRCRGYWPHIYTEQEGEFSPIEYKVLAMMDRGTDYVDLLFARRA